MVWFKVDDNLAFHAKVTRAGNAAMGLWVRAGSWSAQHLTDGFIPEQIAGILGTAPQAAKLVKAGLWDATEGGFRFHSWDERQPKRDAIESEREAKRERMRSIRERKRDENASNRDAFSASSQVSGTRAEEHLSTPPEVCATPVPSRPDPTRPDTPNGVSSPARRKPERPLPSDWEPTDKHWEKAAELGVDLESNAEKFRDHAAANDRRARDWDAAFRSWLRQAAEYAARDAQRRTQPSRHEQNLAVVRQLAEREGYQLQIGDT